MDRARVCIVGTGWTATNHFAGYSAIPDKAHVVAIVARSDASAAKAAEWGVPRIHRDYDDALKDGDIQAMDLCVPHALHAGMAEAALESGRHVMTETQTCITLEECRRLRVALRLYPDLVAATGHIVRVWRTYRHAKQIAESGGLGHIFHATSDYTHKAPEGEYPSRDTWGWNPLMTGRLSIGYHSVDLLRWIVGDVDEVWADYNDEAKVAVLRFKTGALGHVLTSSAVAHPYILSLQVRGLEGSLFCTWQEDVLRGQYHRSIEWDPSELERQPMHGRGSTEWKDEMEAFVDAIREGSETPSPMLDGIETVETCIAIDHAMTVRSAVRVRSL